MQYSTLAELMVPKDKELPSLLNLNYQTTSRLMILSQKG